MTSLGRFANERYRAMRMPPPQALPSEERSTMFVDHPTEFLNCRRMAQNPSLTREGFTLVDHTPATATLYKHRDVVTFFRECRKLCAELTGCTKTKLLQYQYRQSSRDTTAEAPESKQVRIDDYEQTFHVDATPFSEIRLEDLCEERHFQIINFWRSSERDLGIDTMPLAMCDIRSVDCNDIVLAEYHPTRDRSLRDEHYRLIRHNDQRWCYFANMMPNEMLVHKQYDSREPARDRRSVFHGAVPISGSSEKDQPRRSIELRVLALFEKESDRSSRMRRFLADHPE